jgi:uncharacterized protein (TIGR02300 family)
MATKADRGAKRVCLNCRNKFYDLGRDPIICPICQSVFEPMARAAKPVFAAAKAPKPADDDVLPAITAGVELVSLDEVAAAEREDAGDIDADGIEDIEAGEDLDGVDAGDTFLEEVDDDEADSDMTDLVGGGHTPDDEV